MAHHDFCRNPKCSQCEPEAFRMSRIIGIEKRLDKLDKQSIPMPVVYAILRKHKLPMKGRIPSEVVIVNRTLEFIKEDVKAWKRRLRKR